MVLAFYENIWPNMSMTTYAKFLRNAKARREKIVVMYRDGVPMTDIATDHGISRQRVQQILSSYGLSRNDGGANLRAEIRKDTVKSIRDELYIKKYGYSYAEYIDIRTSLGNPAKCFREHRRNAAKRGIRWKLNFRQWWEIWSSSGRWNERGKKTGQFVMARTGDKGPYAVGNVQIITTNQNIKNGYKYRNGVDIHSRNSDMRILRYSKGWKLKDIAKKYGLSIDSVMKIVGKRHG